MSAVVFQSSPAEHPPCILVVEDELFVRMLVSDSLREAGFDVIEAANADEAKIILHSGATINLILSDVRMPGSTDGLGLLDYSLENFPKLPVIIMSGHLAPDEALSRGAARFLGKPYCFDHAAELITLELAEVR